jgi:2-methylcitrate dehydratase PrpD
MAGETLRLAEYAAALRYDRIPPPVLRRAKDCLIDTVAAAIFGHDFTWSRIVLGLARARGPGTCSILGETDPASQGVPAEAAALANGVLAHASELDSLRQPGAGVHPGAVLVPAALAAAQEVGAGGPELLAAIVAGAEVLCRIGKATRHSAETRGFHAPGLTGPFGATIAAGRLYGLDADQMAQALGIAGSLGGGLLEFARSGQGGMVKRLHLGRAAESGIVAARLAAQGFTGPTTVLEGGFGFLNAYCAEQDVSALTAGLDTQFETLTICLKRYPCHITAHTPVAAVQALRADHDLRPEDIARVTVAGSRKMAELHGRQDPQDLVMAQYSIPFCVAVALLRDADDPHSFGETSLNDPAIRALCRRVEVVDGGQHGWATTTRIALSDGHAFERTLEDFPGTPSRPLDPESLRTKFMRLTTRLAQPDAAQLHARLEGIESETDLHWVGTAGGRTAKETLHDDHH